MFRILSTSNFRIILDLLALVLVFAGLEWALRQPENQAELGIPNSWGTSNGAITTLAYFQENDPPDMIVVGSSVAQTSIMPRRLSEALEAQIGQRYSVVNLAGNYFSPDLVYEFVTKTLPQMHLPNLILYPLFPPDLGVYSEERVETYLKNSSLAAFWYGDAWYLPYLRPALIGSQWAQYSLNLSNIATGTFHPIPLNNYRGFNYLERVDLAVGTNAAGFDFTSFSPDTLAAERLAALLEWGEGRGILFILMPSPLPATYVGSPQAREGNLAAFRAYLAGLAAEHPNALYLDLLAEGGLSLEGGFADEVHVNVYGAEVWTDRVGAAMLAIQEEWRPVVD